MYKVHNWEELYKLKDISETHEMLVHFGYGCCRLTAKDGGRNKYLSTHTFYDDKNRVAKSKILQECGFDIELCEYKKFEFVDGIIKLIKKED